MTHAATLLTVLSDGCPRTAGQLQADCGLSQPAVRHAIKRPVNTGSITASRTRPIAYAITPKGRERLRLGTDFTPNAPIVSQALKRSPVSVWAYAARSAS